MQLPQLPIPEVLVRGLPDRELAALCLDLDELTVGVWEAHPAGQVDPRAVIREARTVLDGHGDALELDRLCRTSVDPNPDPDEWVRGYPGWSPIAAQAAGRAVLAVIWPLSRDMVVGDQTQLVAGHVFDAGVTLNDITDSAAAACGIESPVRNLWAWLAPDWHGTLDELAETVERFDS